MEKLLREKLWKYIIENNPDLVLQLEEDQSVNDYLKKKVEGIQPMLSRLSSEGAPGYIIEEIGMEMLTRDLRPSRFNYIQELLEEDFEDYFLRLQETGLLTYEIVNLITECEKTFEGFEFSENEEDDKRLRYVITGKIRQYIESK